MLTPTVTEVKRPNCVDTFHGSLASLKCKIWCLTSDTVCVASTAKEIDAVLKNKWSVGNIYLVISSLSVYFLKNSVKLLLKFFFV